MRSPQKKERSMQSFTEKRKEHMTEVIANLLEHHGSKYFTIQHVAGFEKTLHMGSVCNSHNAHF